VVQGIYARGVHGFHFGHQLKKMVDVGEGVLRLFGIDGQARELRQTLDIGCGQLRHKSCPGRARGHGQVKKCSKAGLPQ
jgi:hypothetical protein